MLNSHSNRAVKWSIERRAWLAGGLAGATPPAGYQGVGPGRLSLSKAAGCGAQRPQHTQKHLLPEFVEGSLSHARR